MIKEISNLLLPIIFYLLPLSASAQRDYQLTEQRNHWLTSDNAAALVTYADSSISKASLSYGYEGGSYRGISDGKDEMTITADARSYYRLSNRVMSYGSVTYTNFSGTDMSGSMLSKAILSHYGDDSSFSNPHSSFSPFDILQPSDDAGRKHLEMFNVVGAVGWNIYKGLSVGAKADFSAGNYSKYKDLRHANTLMNLNTNASVLYRFGSRGSNGYGIGASFLYNRSTETVKYKTYGTTDHIYHVLLDYANQQGETLTYGGDGFIDDNTELPLFDEQCGFSLQASWMRNPDEKTFKNSPSLRGKGQLAGVGWGWVGVGLSFSYLHRHGYYGRQSQYTASYEQHSGNSYNWQIRVDMPHTRNTLSWLNLSFCSQGLTSNKTNYRQVKSTDNNSVTYYEYYTPTKMADKLLNSSAITYTLYLKPQNTCHHALQNISEYSSPRGKATGRRASLGNGCEGTFYLWQINVGTQYLYSKQTAYLYPSINTRKANLWMPFIQGRRNIIFRNTNVLGVQLGLSANCGDMDIMMDGIGKQVRESVAMSYELPVFAIRTNVTLRYSCAQSSDSSYSGLYRHTILLSLGALF